MPLRYTQRILEHLKHGGYRPALPSAIAKAMRIERDDRPAFDEAISMLAGDARVEIGSDGKVRLPSFGDEVVVSTADGSRALSPVALALDRADIGVRELALRTPTLDDVFLEVTGGRLEGGDA